MAAEGDHRQREQIGEDKKPLPVKVAAFKLSKRGFDPSRQTSGELG